MYEPYEKLPELKYFKRVDLEEIETMSAGLSEEEVLSYYALEVSELLEGEDATPTADLIWLRKAQKRGRAKAQMKAVSKLFSSMSDRNGGQYSLAYLRQMADKWEAGEGNGGGEGFSFKVMMDGKPK